MTQSVSFSFWALRSRVMEPTVKLGTLRGWKRSSHVSLPCRACRWSITSRVFRTFFGGSFCYHFPSQKILLSGDTLFHHQLGFTDIMPLQSDEALRGAIVDRLLTLPDDTKVYPGHREPPTIGEENAWGTLYRSSN